MLSLIASVLRPKLETTIQSRGRCGLPVVVWTTAASGIPQTFHPAVRTELDIGSFVGHSFAPITIELVYHQRKAISIIDSTCSSWWLGTKNSLWPCLVDAPMNKYLHTTLQRYYYCTIYKGSGAKQPRVQMFCTGAFFPTAGEGNLYNVLRC